MKTIAFCNVKGGTGKSTLSILTALTLAGEGHRVLILDMDPQNSTTFFFLEDPGAASIFNVLTGEQPDRHILPTPYNVDIIPSDIRLLDLRSMEHNRLKGALKKISEYDFVIIDSAPTYDGLTINAYMAADVIIIPSTVDAFSAKTVHFLIDKLADLEVGADIGICLNMWTRPKTEKAAAWGNREASLFTEGRLSEYLLNTSFPRVTAYRRIMAEPGYKVTGQAAVRLSCLVNEITGIQATLEKIG